VSLLGAKLYVGRVRIPRHSEVAMVWAQLSPTSATPLNSNAYRQIPWKLHANRLVRSLTPPDTFSWRVMAPFVLIGFVRAFKPSDPFLIRFLTRECGFAESFVNNVLYPLWTYAYLVFLLPINSLAKRVGFRNIVIGNSLTQVLGFALMFWGKSSVLMQVLSMCVLGLENALQTGFYSFPFKLTESTKLQHKMTSYCFTSVMLGACLGAVIGQVMYSTLLRVAPMFYLTIPCSALSLLFAMALLPSEESFYGDDGLPAQHESQSLREGSGATKKSIWIQLQRAVSSPSVLLWSALYVMSYTGYYNSETYSSNLFFEINSQVEFNGLIQAFAGLSSAIGSIIPGVCVRFTTQHSLSLSAYGSLGCAVLILIMSYSQALVPAYVGFILYDLIVHLLLALITARLPGDKQVDDSSHEHAERMSLLLSFNDVLSTVSFSVMQLLVSQIFPHGKVALRFSIQGILSIVFSLPFILLSIKECCQSSKPQRKETLILEETSPYLQVNDSRISYDEA